MIRPARLKNSDVRDVFRLLTEVTELGRDPAAWRSHLTRGILPLIDARVGMAAEHYIAPGDRFDTRVTGMIDVGFDPEQREIYLHFMQTGAFVDDPFHAVVARLNFRSFTRRRRDFISDEAWYGAPSVSQARQLSNVDDSIHCRCRLPQTGWSHTMTFMRDWGGKPFGVRERFVVSLINRELGRLWSQVDSGPLAALPPRLRQTLDMIFCGYSEKEMAQALRVSRHTIHDFARRLYRHFGVSGRSGLLVNPDCRRLMFRPALSAAYYVEDRQIEDFTFHGPANTPKQGD